MNNTPSIAHEFYKVREEWARIEKLKHWSLAVWVAGYQDIDIIDKFIETESLAIGVFDDIFFRFETTYKGNPVLFEEELWQEYRSWFEKTPQPSKQDVIGALKNDGILSPDFEPQFHVNSGFTGLIREMLRLKHNLEGYEATHFCLYFPPAKANRFLLGDWLNRTLKKELPSQIRLITIDYAANRKIFVSNYEKVVELTPQLNMLAAINNEMDKGGGRTDAVSPESRLTKQIRVVMDSILKNNKDLTLRESRKMIGLAKETQNPSTLVSSLLVASQAHYNIKDHEPSEQYAEEAIIKAEALMNDGDAAGFHCWKACMMLKGALLSAKRKWEKAIAVYDALAEKALSHGDIFFTMEGHRISGHLYYLRGRMQPAFEQSLLALVAGSYLSREMMRQSTFLHAAYLAHFIGEKIKPQDELKILEDQLQDWVGEDWKELISSSELEKSTTKPRSRFMPPVSF
ncbi:hypothetical protein [Niabella drilacis]|uniref:Uncharacterized protein n=1 Tax=Niabella drilacis (strain DSM 25811 / CCM 8410 / CCUG 62505 / LMG 26954 / E90) TaxID=1285928 RepID=A0A1G6KPT0_NIADE|nr:hypothetical protein [Niabella drilacis]SDC32907.1 hypothetical protein SAMN04487894_10253 [Niabella drilacis]